MNMKLNCCVVLLAVLSASCVAEDVNVKVKVGVDDGEPERQELKNKIIELVKVNEQLRSAVDQLEHRPRIDPGRDITSVCVDPTYVHTKHDLFKPNEVPGEDDLDVLIANKTGCKITGLEVKDAFDVTTDFAFDGHNAYTELFGVRGLEHAYINVWWKGFKSSDYWIAITDQGYEAKSLGPNHFHTLLRKPAPGAIAPNHYEKYYIYINNEYLLFGRVCESNPILRQKISIAEGDKISLRFRTDSYYGAKFLYHCPVQAVVQHGIIDSAVDWAIKKVVNKGLEMVGLPKLPFF